MNDDYDYRKSGFDSFLTRSIDGMSQVNLSTPLPANTQRVSNQEISESTGNILDLGRIRIDGATGNIIIRDDQGNILTNINSVVTDQMIQTGWGYIKGDGSVNISGTVTMPVTYDSAPVVLVSLLGAKSDPEPTAITDLTDNYGSYQHRIGAISITTSSFVVDLYRDDGLYGSTVSYVYSWIAIGTGAR